jgi:hypothetical protein
MKPTIRCVLVLLIGSILIGTAFAECVRMNMPCCFQHASNKCHEICTTPTANVSSPPATDFSVTAHTATAVVLTLPAPRVISGQITREFAVPSENLLTRIHVLQI